MKFKRINTGIYQATRKDGQVITIEATEYSGDMSWRSSYEGDFDGDNNGFAKNKKELVAFENFIEANI